MPCPGNDNIAGFMRSLGYDFAAEASPMAGDEQVTAVVAFGENLTIFDNKMQCRLASFRQLAAISCPPRLTACCSVSLAPSCMTSMRKSVESGHETEDDNAT